MVKHRLFRARCGLKINERLEERDAVVNTKIRKAQEGREEEDGWRAEALKTDAP